MHLRRALLLFAIVLGLAAIAASISRSGDDDGDSSPQVGVQSPTGKEPTVEAGPATGAVSPATIELSAGYGEASRLEAGRAGTFEVEVAEPGLVEIPRLGLSATAEPLTPARFELLVHDPGRYPVLFTPAGQHDRERAGTLLVTEPDR